MMRQPDNAAVLDQVSALNRLIDTKAFSWTLAMEDLESVLPGGVQVTTLEPIVDKKDGHITVRMRVVGARDKAVDLVSNLEHSRRFLLPRITGESAESTGNGAQQQVEPVSLSNRVNFDLLADYNPATPGERKTVSKKAGHAAQAAESPVAPVPGAATPRIGSPGRQRTPYAGAPRPQRSNPNHPAGGPR
jgi:type IV pilus assembly protein PilN